MKWFRLYDEIQYDTKLRRMPITHRYAFIILLCMANRSPVRGVILNLDDEDLAFELEMQTEDWLTLKAKFRTKGLIDLVEGGIKISNWDERQFASDSSSERVAAYRDRKRKGKCNVTPPLPKRDSNGSVTPSYTDPDPDPKNRSETDQDQIEEPEILRIQNFDRASFENSNFLEDQEEFPCLEIRDESATPLKRASIEGKTEIYGMTSKSSGGALTGRSGPNPETFDSWWKTYRKMCLMINAQAGKRKEAWEEWQKNYEAYESPHFEECDRLYREGCGQQMMQRGNVYGVAHGCRYLRGPLWQDAFDRAELLANSPVDFANPKAVKQLGQRFEQQKINSEVRELLAKREAQNDVRHF